MKTFRRERAQKSERTAVSNIANVIADQRAPGATGRVFPYGAWRSTIPAMAPQLRLGLFEGIGRHRQSRSIYDCDRGADMSDLLALTNAQRGAA
jgi:hypothetical protein